MELTAAVNPQERYVSLGAIAYNERVILILDRGYVVGSVLRADICSIGLELRPSFKHPVIGLVLGGLLFTGSVGTALMGLYFNPILTLSLAFAGAVLLFGAARTRKVPWLILMTRAGERAFMLYEVVTQDVERFVQAVNASCGESEPQQPTAALGFPMIPQADRAGKE